MMRRRNNVAPLSHNHRKSPKRAMGLPSRRPGRHWRLADPRFFFSAAIVVASAGLIVLPTLADGALALTRPAAATGAACRINRVVDGDTVRMWCPGSGIAKARLTGFDTPELFSPSCASELAAAIRAKWALRLALLRADELRLVPEGRDRYGRALVAVFVDGAPLARAMIAAGHARAYAGGARQGWCA